MPTTVNKTLNTGSATAGDNFQTWADFATWASTQNLVTADQLVVLTVQQSMALQGFLTFSLAGQDATRYVQIKPATPFGAGADYDASGIEITAHADEALTVNAGFEFSGFRIKVINGNANSAGFILSGASNVCRITRNKFLHQGGGRIVNFSGAAAEFLDNLCFTEAGAKNFIHLDTNGKIQRNTFVARGTADATKQAIYNEWGDTGVIIKDNYFHGVEPLLRNGAESAGNITNNFTNRTMTGSATGFTVQTTPALVGSATDLFPTSTSNLRSAASASANSTLDLFGTNRSTSPDVGAVEYAAAATVPGAPTIGTATAGNASASVTFTAPASDGGAAITGYTVTSTPGSITATGASSPINVTGLTNGTAYTFTAHATNSVGNSAESAASNSVTPAVPVKTATVTLKSRAGTAAASLTGIRWAWWDTTDLSTIGAPTDKGAAETTDGSGVIVVQLPNTTKTSGQSGLLALYDSTGTNRFFGIVTVD